MMRASPVDMELLQGLRAGHKEAFQRLYQHYFLMVRFLVMQNSGTATDADDVFQDGLLVLMDKLRLGEFELTASLKTYLYAVCRNLWRKRLRDKGKTKWVDFEEAAEVAIEEAEDGQAPLLLQLRQCLETIGDACRRLLERVYFLNMRMDEIATDLGYTNADSVKTQKYKCILRLKKMMDAKNPKE